MIKWLFAHTSFSRWQPSSELFHGIECSGFSEKRVQRYKKVERRALRVRRYFRILTFFTILAAFYSASPIMIWFYASPLRTRTSSPDLSKIWGVLTMLNPWLLSKDASSVFWHKGISIFIQQAIQNCLYKCLCEKGSLAILWPFGRKRASFGGFVSDWEWAYCESRRTWMPSKMAENRHF